MNSGLEPENEPLIEMLFRNGTLTVVGIVLSFSLGFVSHWAANPLPWEVIDLPTILLLAGGIACQINALRILIEPDSVRQRVYDRAKRSFLRGVIAVSAGVVLAVAIDFLQLAKLPLL
ncbi:hypothetical protein M728_002386 [Ensifer sp. WSM1721]|uniref:hypothetical protein n=1 Tax=Ensifer sp. WSM1721 TaxID=1041159 RepID=UPI00047A4D22|nr:hypothetical protein [Ensifer sp. WSM1721]